MALAKRIRLLHARRASDAESMGKLRMVPSSPDPADGPARDHAPAMWAQGERPGGEGEPGFGRIAPTVILSLVTICIAADFIGDLARGESALHLTGMAVGTILSIGGVALLLRILARSRARSQELAVALDHSRADCMRWSKQARRVLSGLGELIDKQFGEWGLSPSERAVGLLLLKGLSLRDIAGVRKASEATVRQQAQAVYRKADLAGRAELSAFFLEDLLLPRDAAANAPQSAELGEAQDR